MILWRLCGDFGGFAEASSRGTWGNPITDLVSERLRPLIISWRPGLAPIGDFTWPGIGGDVFVKHAVGQELAARFSGFELGPVKAIPEDVDSGESGAPDPAAVIDDLMRPPWRPAPPKRRRWPTGYDLPGPHNDGVERSSEVPAFADLFVTARCPPDLTRTTFKANGRHIDGAEHFDHVWNSTRTKMLRQRVPREPGRGVFVREADLGGAAIFRVGGFTWTFCRPEVCEFVEARKYTNVCCLVAGEIL